MPPEGAPHGQGNKGIYSIIGTLSSTARDGGVLTVVRSHVFDLAGHDLLAIMTARALAGRLSTSGPFGIHIAQCLAISLAIPNRRGVMENGGSHLKVSANSPEDLKATMAALPLAAARIQSYQTMRLGLYILAAIFAITSAVIIIFAPNGREIATGIVTVALCVLAAGCAGYGTFGLKTPVASLEAKQTTHDYPSSPQSK
jgi:hypothetical protein